MLENPIVYQTVLHLTPRVTPKGAVVFDGQRFTWECRFGSLPCERLVKTESAGMFREAEEVEKDAETGLVFAPPSSVPGVLQTGPLALRVTAI